MVRKDKWFAAAINRSPRSRRRQRLPVGVEIGSRHSSVWSVESEERADFRSIPSNSASSSSETSGCASNKRRMLH